MGRRLTRAVIGTGIAVSLLGWGAGRLGEITRDTLRPELQAVTADHKGAIPTFSIHLSIEVRP